MARDEAPPGRGLSLARVKLGQVFRPLPTEFLVLLSVAALLTIFGIVMVFSATTVSSMRTAGSPYDDGVRHLIFAIVGVPVMLLTSRLPAVFFRRAAWVILVLALGLQALVFSPLGFATGGNRNWINVGISVQPSEFLKLALVIWGAAVLYRNRQRLGTLGGIALPLVPGVLIALGSVMAGGDLGTVLVMALIVLAVLFFSGIRIRVIVMILLLAGAAITALTVSSENRMDRITSLFIDCTVPSNYLGPCFQPMHGLWAISSGGLFGLGLGNSQEKYDWLPASADDYIFAIVGEELGLLGCLAVIALIAAYAWAGLRVVRRADDLFVRIAAGGITAWVVGQAFINIGVVLRIFPALGVPLPFLSSGGSALAAVLLATGVLLSFARVLPAPGETAPRARRPGARGKIVK